MLGGGGRQGALQEGREEQKKDKVSVAMTGSTHTRRAGVEARAGEGVTLAAAAPRALLCNWHTGASTAQPVFGYIIMKEGGGLRAAAVCSEPKVGVRSKAQRRSAITPPSALGAEGS